MPNSLSKIVDLVKKTGDTCVVLDAQGNPSYVVVSFDKYQQLATAGAQDPTSLAGLTENELLNKINHDIAAWKASVGQADLDFEGLVKMMDQSQSPVAVQDETDIFSSKKSLNKAEKEEKTEVQEKYYFEPID